MRIKKVIADNYSEALDRVKNELGESALVLSTRSIKFNKDQDADRCSTLVEITAALDEDAQRESAVAGEKGSEDKEHFFENPGEDLRQLRSMVVSLLSQTDKARSLGLQETQLPIYQKLLDQGVDDRLVSRLFESFNKKEQGKGGDLFISESGIADRMKSAMQCGGAIPMASEGPKVVALVGPTGAGKTTTIAKLAARFALQQKKRVGLISLDTYRMGALEQLEAYGDLMRVPVVLAADRNDFAEAIREFQDMDIVLVDTMGKSHRDEDYCQQLNNIFQAVPQIEIHLVQSATSQESVVSACFKQFSPLGIDRVLFTKLDEAVNFGLLFNCSIRHRIPFSYLTDGQRVPEDIEVATPEKVIRLIFN